MTSIGRPVTGQDISMAARATRKALDVVLAEQARCLTKKDTRVKVLPHER